MQVLDFVLYIFYKKVVVSDEVIGIEENTVFVKLNIKIEEVDSLINLYVVMEDKTKKIIGEIANIKDLIAEINLVGELKGSAFVPGVIKKPSFGSTVKLIARDKVDFIACKNTRIKISKVP